MKDAINEALRDWVTNVDDTYFSSQRARPHPIQLMVRQFQSIIGTRSTRTILSATEDCRRADRFRGWAQMAIGLFSSFHADGAGPLWAYKLEDEEIVRRTRCGFHSGTPVGGGQVGVLAGHDVLRAPDANGQIRQAFDLSRSRYSADWP